MKCESKSVVNLAGVRKWFGNRAVLEGVSFQVTGKQGLCICGVNATGKTTLLKIIASLVKPNDGVIEICGLDVRTRQAEIKPLIGVIFHSSMVYPQLTVVENLRFFAALYGIKNNNAYLEELLEQTALTRYCYDRAEILSRGMMQRLAIARALIHKPSILLADEPFAGLDGEAGSHLVAIINGFKKRGGSVVLTSHNVNFAMQCCEDVAVLHEGKLIFNAKVSDIDAGEFAADYLSYTMGK